MDALSRRRFLSSALAAGAGAILIEPFARADVSRAAGATLTDVDPGFVAGEVATVMGQGQLGVVDLDGRMQTLVLAKAARVWRNGDVDISDPAVKDCVFARGERRDDGSLLVQKIWSNLVKVDGRTTQHTSSSLSLVNDDGKPVTATFSDKTVVVRPDGSEVSGPTSPLLASRLAADQDLTIIGYQNPGSGFQASRVVMAGDGTTQPKAISPASVCLSRVVHSAVASFQCCGGTYGCATARQCNYGNGGGGACGTCRSDLRQITWPKMNGNLCGPSNGCDLPAGFENHSCSAFIPIQDACRSTCIDVKVSDCGPNTRCRPTGCKGYQSVWWDLTPCAFTAIGADLDIGHCDLLTGPAHS